MRVVRTGGLLAVALACSPVAVLAQPDSRTLSPLELTVACAPPPSLASPVVGALHIAGSQDTVSRSIYDPHDRLIVSGGTDAGLQVGQQFFVRRAVYFATTRGAHPSGFVTLGWIRIIAVNDKTAIASIDHYCSAFYRDDYLEPFVAPSIPAEAVQDAPLGTLDFSSLGRVVSGINEHSAVAPGDLLMVDRGAEQGAKVGDRFAVYRDIKAAGVPLSSVGEGVIVATGKFMAIARITRSSDAIVAGDYVVPGK
jgi:hypothetical protein